MTTQNETWPEVGKTYRCADGIVRWCTSKGPSGVYYLRWLDEEARVWYYGGTCGGRWRKGRGRWPWVGGEEIPGPQPGDKITRAFVYGRYEYTVPPLGTAQAP